MEQNNLPIAKRIWSIVRVAFFMIRKGISKRKLLLDFNMMMKRGKLASKTLSNLMFHKHHHSHSHPYYSGATSSAAQREYEFSCSNTPNYPFHLMGKRCHDNNHHNLFKCTHALQTQDDEMAIAGAVTAVLEMLNNEAVTVEAAAYVATSPVLPGFGKSPMVHQLRITDSPFPVREADEESHVDKAAEEFIEKFYKNLWQQRRMHDE
ncbi:hypothetical protein D8674_035206 [Pyrus ussuriensis x Pyrus communis]|uniref:Avr9/Cf-9 rapidly elicited protein n=1 Tax=Pyrus ussuriensis x Pyrus communis TaxID=2448454 RepID=A0A5N5GHP2_9ROSA|nr:hypothetical protein D8674_035206 [Pyrus ussuriensis x Pyrus communis]